MPADLLLCGVSENQVREKSRDRVLVVGLAVAVSFALVIALLVENAISKNQDAQEKPTPNDE